MAGPSLGLCLDGGIPKGKVIVICEDAESAFHCPGMEEPDFSEMSHEEFWFFLSEENAGTAKLLPPSLI